VVPHFLWGSRHQQCVRPAQKKVGEPYQSFPVDAYVFLEGEMVGWGTVCGFHAETNIVSDVIIGPRIAGEECEYGAAIGADALRWYFEASLPE
jgi:hypothetical protein